MIRPLLFIALVSIIASCGGRPAATGSVDSGPFSDGPPPSYDGIGYPDGFDPTVDAFVPRKDAQFLKMDLATPVLDGGGGIPCSSPASCAGYGCNTALGICRTACYSDGHCAFDHTCNAVNQCVPASGCSDDSSCLPFACDQSVGQCRANCDRDSHCSQGNVCDNGQCIPATPCTDDTPCGGYLCNIQGNTQDGVCRVSCAGFGFGGGPSCAAGYVCGATGCTPEQQCTDAVPCNGYACESGTCRTLCFLPQHCDTDYQCGSGFACTKNVACSDPSACAGYACENSVCRTFCFLPQHCAAGYICNISFGSQMATCVPQ